MSSQLGFFDDAGVIAEKLSQLCPYETHCGARADIGACERVSAECCNHAITCQRCGRTGVESWNLTIGAAAHQKARA